MKKRSSTIEIGPEKESSLCLFCRGTLYRLGDGRVKCRRCRRRYSPRKFERLFALADAFCRGLSAAEAARECATTPLTAQKAFEKFRTLIVPWLESRYEAHRDAVVEFDELFYLDRNKRRDRRHIFDAHNILVFDYGKGVYTLLMPSLARYKTRLLDDGMEEIYARELSIFLTLHPVSRLRSAQNAITRFRHFLDTTLARYRGIERERFIYFLKEAEFKFNEAPPRAREILQGLIIQEASNDY